ncbi:MAG: transporter substrate-binding domain-containing protein [Coprococcus sp.]|nr:transporter substrate-binding domain-containing protein [Coprococcus sp.]
MKKIFLKRLMLAALSVTILASVVGCGASTDDKDKSGDGSAEGSSGGKLQEIIDKGKIVIGVYPPGEPQCFYDDKGNLMGLDIDWANKLAETIGVDVEFVEVNGENRISMVTTGRVDVIIANTTGNLERAKSINFSIPYLKTGIKLGVRKGLDEVQEISDLNDPKYTIAAESGTTSEELALQYAPNANIIYQQNLSDCLLSIQEGKADAMMHDGTSIDYAASQDDYLESRPTIYTSDPICIGYAKGDADFGRYLDMFVSTMITNGFEEETYDKWFGTVPTGELQVLY